MEFNWTTFFLEIINFLVLVWLLKRFFYRPVLNVIEKRRSNIELSLTEASQTKQEADILQQQYINRLNDWEQEKAQQRLEFQQELNMEREKRLKVIDEELKKNHEKAEFIINQQKEQFQKIADKQAIKTAALFTKKLLMDFSGPELTTRFLQRAIRDFNQLPVEKVNKIKHAWLSAPESIKIISAHDLPLPSRKELENAIQSLLDAGELDCLYETDNALIAGVRIQLGSWILRASIQDEFAFFVEASHETS